jgi:hypothetical protein
MDPSPFSTLMSSSWPSVEHGTALDLESLFTWIFVGKRSVVFPSSTGSLHLLDLGKMWSNRVNFFMYPMKPEMRE